MTTEDVKRITWRNETRKLRDLIPWPDNPRRIEVDQADRHYVNTWVKS